MRTKTMCVLVGSMLMLMPAANALAAQPISPDLPKFWSLDYRYGDGAALEAGQTAISRNLPIGTSSTAAVQALKRAGAHCYDTGLATSIRCAASVVDHPRDDVETRILWTVDLDVDGDKLAGIHVSRDHGDVFVGG